MQGWSDKGEVEKALIAGIHGTPELKREERRRYLGEFAERVLAAITKEQVGQPQLDPGVAKAVKDPRATMMIAHMDLAYADLVKYSRLAEEQGIPFTRRSDPSYQGDVGLIVVSDEAVS